MKTTELRVTDTAGSHQFAIVDDNTGQDVAIVYNRDEHSKETAQLLAAAPELLEALQGMIEYANALENNVRTSLDKYYKAMSAIEKATNP